MPPESFCIWHYEIKNVTIGMVARLRSVVRMIPCEIVDSST